MPIKSQGLRDYVDPLQNTVNLLESDQPLPDDDPKTRNGGLDPARGKDIDQIKMYMAMRQSGQISDNAWSRLIQRNPRSATLFSVVGPSPEVLQAKNRNAILSRYFSPEQQAVPFQTTEEQAFGLPELTGNVAQEAQAGRADKENAIKALVGSGDIAGAKELLGVVDPRQGSKARPLQIQTVDTKGNPTTIIIDPETMQPIREYPMVPKALGSGDIEKIASAASIYSAFKGLNANFQTNYGGYKASAIGEAAKEYQARFGGDASPMVDWWQQYQDQKNRIRKELYGSALTQTEAREFDKANIHMGMKPAQIKANLSRQEEIYRRALSRLQEAYGPRYDTRQIKGATGTLEPPPMPANSPSASSIPEGWNVRVK